MNNPNCPRCPVCNKKHPPLLTGVPTSGLLFIPLCPPTPQQVRRILKAKKDMHRQSSYNAMGDEFLRNWS